jgi:hypothetical protein
MGTMQDKLGRGVVYAGCVGFRSLWRATALRGKEPGVGSCSDVPARKSKMLAAHCCLVMWMPPLWRLPFGIQIKTCAVIATVR